MPVGRRAAWVVALLVATLAVGLLLLVAFEPDVQTMDAEELASRSDDARAFFAGDYVFILLYAVLSPIAIWRLGSALTGGSPPAWIKLTSLLLVAAGLVDGTENALLLAASDSASQDTVDVAHAVAVPKVILFVAGAALALGVNVRAVRVLRRGVE